MSELENRLYKLEEKLDIIERKVSHPEWLDVLILDLMKPQFDELKRLIGRSTHIDTCIDVSGGIEKRLNKLEKLTGEQFGRH